MDFRFYTDDEGYEELDKVFDVILSENELDRGYVNSAQLLDRLNALNQVNSDIYHIMTFFRLSEGGGVEGYLLSYFGRYLSECQRAAARVGCEGLVKILSDVQLLLPEGGLSDDVRERESELSKNRELREKMDGLVTIFPEDLWVKLLDYHKKSQ